MLSDKAPYKTIFGKSGKIMSGPSSNSFATTVHTELIRRILLTKDILGESCLKPSSAFFAYCVFATTALSGESTRLYRTTTCLKKVSNKYLSNQNKEIGVRKNETCSEKEKDLTLAFVRWHLTSSSKTRVSVPCLFPQWRLLFLPLPWRPLCLLHFLQWRSQIVFLFLKVESNMG